MLGTRKRVGVVLCGCGHRDGSEVHEATLALLAIDRAGAEALCFAPTGNTASVRDHLTGQEAPGRRSMLVESARIARGRIADISTASAFNLDALVIPGGQGAALNLSSYLADGVNCSVLPEVARIVGEMVKAGKPIGAICIAPATLARALQKLGVAATMTCGTDQEVAKAIGAMGHRHVECAAAECVVDHEHKIVTTPAYMNATSIGEVWQGIEKLVNAVMEMT